MVAGIETLKGIRDDTVWEQFAAAGRALDVGIQQAAAKAGVPIHQTRVGTMHGLFFTDQRVTDYASAKTSDTRRFAHFFRAMLSEGIYLAPSQFEAGFLATAHGTAEIEQTVAAAWRAFKQL